jgi:hypothetical protein
MPTTTTAILAQVPGADWLVGTTGLSHFQRGRYAPSASWTALWSGVLKWLDADGPPPRLVWQPTVHPSFSATAALAPDTYQASLRRLARWYLHSGVMPDAAGEKTARSRTSDNIGTASLTAITGPGDGTHGILEGFESSIQPDGSQNYLVPLRADCCAESAMALALSSAFTSETIAGDAAANLLQYIYSTSGMCGGERGDPASPAYGLIAWGMGSDAWERANYGDDNARALLASIAAASTLKTDRWNVQILRAILANYRTTGRNGFRGDRIDMPELRANGWRHYFDADTINNSPHFEAYLWACYLVAYRATNYQPLLDRARAGIAGMMKTFPDGWRRNDMIERAHLLLPLAWLVRVDDTPQSRQWLNQLCDDLLRDQAPSGALPERENGGVGHYQAPKSNEEYGTAETPLIQQTGDKATDQLYTTGFALIGLHEAAAATGDPRLKAAEDKLADYLVRIQTRSHSPKHDGVWFRAFDYGRWDYWASSADLGWGAWVIETGWGQTWIAATFALRENNTTLWDLSRQVDLKTSFPAVLQQMELETSSTQFTRLVWSDEFDRAGAPDPARWSYEVGYKRNSEIQYYTSASLANAAVKDGMLAITARKEDAKSTHPVTSASLISKGKGFWKRGRIEVRAKVPSALGTWPAIWPGRRHRRLAKKRRDRHHGTRRF